MANLVRNRLHPTNAVSYTITCNINYTNICISGCKFCAFYRRQNDPQAYLLNDEQILTAIGQGLKNGAIRVLLQGGLHPDLGIDYFERLFNKIRQKYQIQIHALSPPEIIHLSQLSGLNVTRILQRLKASGLDSIPGGGAEILSQRTRAALSPKKCSADDWLYVMEIAHSLGLPSSATMMFGHMETKEEILEHLLRLRALQDKSPGFIAFIPWTYQPGNTAKAAEEKIGRAAVSAFDYLRTLAVSRIMLDNIPNLQASLLTQGSKIAQLALKFGANDIGDLLVEEHVLQATGLNQDLSRAEVENLITEMGYQPGLRDTIYRFSHYS